MEPLRLLCLPYAGASAQVYARWRRRLFPTIDVRPVELPGRGAREGEPFATDVCDLAEQLALELLGSLTHECERYALFGHSLGAIVAFELAHALSDLARPPSALLVSGCHAPTRRSATSEPQVLEDAALLERMRAYEGTSEAVFASPELLAMALPVLRADFALGSGYRYVARPPLRVPLHVYGGSSDEPGARELVAWRRETRSAFTVNMFAGGHFYFRGADEALLACMANHLGALREPAPRAFRPSDASP